MEPEPTNPNPRSADLRVGPCRVAFHLGDQWIWFEPLVAPRCPWPAVTATTQVVGYCEPTHLLFQFPYSTASSLFLRGCPTYLKKGTWWIRLNPGLEALSLHHKCWPAPQVRYRLALDVQGTWLGPRWVFLYHRTILDDGAGTML